MIYLDTKIFNFILIIINLICDDKCELLFCMESTDNIVYFIKNCLGLQDKK